MPKNDTTEIINRRLTVSKLLIDGLKPKEIQKKLDISIDTVYDDIKEIKKIAYRQIVKIDKRQLAFQYDLMIQGIELLYKESINRIHQDDLTNDDFVKLSRIAKETITAKHEILKASTSIFQIEDLKQQLKELQDKQQGKNVRSLMNVSMPKYNHEQILTK